MSDVASIRPTPAPAAAVRQSSEPSGRLRLPPDEAFPTRLTELELEQVQVLHSRICCQLEAEYRTAEGPHPVTQDRHEELREELDNRRRIPAHPATRP